MHLSTVGSLGAWEAGTVASSMDDGMTVFSSDPDKSFYRIKGPGTT